MSQVRVSFMTVAVAGLILAFSVQTHAQGNAWGTVKGRIVWDNAKLPPQEEIKAVNQNADKAACLKDGPILSEEWVVNPKNKGIQWTFVWLVDQDPKKPLPIHPKLKELAVPEIVMDQPCCKFIPHATALREGQVLVAKNSAAIAHNFKWTGNQLNANAGGNVQLPGGGEFKIKGLVADRLPVQIECNIHPWMKGWVRVFNHPYYAVTDKDGNFEIKDAPAGKYRMVMWHGSAGFNNGAAGRTGEPIEIKADAPTDAGDIAFKIPPPKN
jgi:hypothetical protein